MKKNIAGKIFGKKDQLYPGRVNDSKKDSLEEIIEGCRKNDASCQESLYKSFYGYALGVALTYCTTRADAVEVVNDSFMKAYKNIKTFDTAEPFKPWLRRIVVNTSIDKIRTNNRHKFHTKLEDTELSSPVNVESELNAKQIYKLLNKLPDLLRFVFNMYEIEGYSHREIAKKLDIAESSSRTYLTRAKVQLRELYREIFMDEL